MIRREGRVDNPELDPLPGGGPASPRQVRSWGMPIAVLVFLGALMFVVAVGLRSVVAPFQ